MPENKIVASIELPPLGFGGFYVNPGKGQGHSTRRGRPRFPDLLHGLAHPGDSLKKASDIPFGSSGIPHVCAPPRPGVAKRSHAARSKTAAKKPSVPCT